MVGRFQTLLNPKKARWLAWVFAGINISLMSIGLVLQAITGVGFAGGPLYVHFSEVLGLCGFSIIGALIAWRHPRNPVGWIWLLISYAFGRDHFVWGYAYYGSIAHPGSLPGAEAMVVFLYWLGRGTLGILGMTLLLLLFPTGRPLSQRWRLIAWIAVARVAVVIPLSILVPDPIGYFPFPTDLIASGDPVQADLNLYGNILNILRLIGILCIVAAGVSLFIRMIRSRGVERQQIKWFVYAAAFLPPTFILIFLVRNLEREGLGSIFLLAAIFALTAVFGMVTASAVAIFRYRLWDIDGIIHRTLVYGLLSVSLAIIYFTSVVLLQRTLQAATGQESPLAVVASTLIIAALFTPLHRRIQNFIDRLFYRRKYNAERVLATLSARLRQDVEITQISRHVLAVVDEALQPESLSLWLPEQGVYMQSSGAEVSPSANDQSD